MSTQRGAAVVWAIDTTMTGTGIGTHIGQSLDYKFGSEQKKIRGTDGVTVTRIFHDNMESITYEIVPTGSTRALAQAANVLPAIGADVTLLSANDTEATGSGTGDGTGAFIFLGGSKKHTVDGECRLTFELERGEKHLVTMA
jgi:hypothetical protein